MALLADHVWKTKYTPDDGDLVEQFYVQALDSAVRYDRTTGFFSAGALSLAARGIEGLVRNNGRMRLLIGCTLDEPETVAIQRGEALRAVASVNLLKMPLVADDADKVAALELLAWMVAKGFLDVKVAVPCDAARRPIAGLGLFHEKAGVIEDKTGERVAFAGSINETAQGWKLNWESFHVFCSWAGGEKHVAAEEESFARLWADKSPRARVVDVPTAVRDELLKFLPADDRLPVRLEQAPEVVAAAAIEAKGVAAESAARADELRRAVWSFIWGAPTLPSGVRIGEATSAVTPWPHQLRAFQRMWEHWPPKLLIADEVGLGKTIEAGMVLRQAWLSGKAKRILILAPKAVLTQWQRELREKFNLDWPIYDGDALVWPPTPAHPDGVVHDVTRNEWQREPFVLASSQLMRRRERQTELLGDSEPWDLVVLDEAHHARRRNPGQPGEGGPNLLLRLMQGLRRKTQGLILLTATPMQVHPLEVFDLLALLQMPPEWSAQAFQEFFRLAAKPNPSHEDFERLAVLFQAVERVLGPVAVDDAIRHAPQVSALRGKRILRALRESAPIPRRQLDADDRRAALSLIRAHTPVSRLISRHTRDLLREYHRLGRIATPIASRGVEDRFLAMSEDEAAVYAAVEDYISTTYNNAAQEERSSVGFVMTIYRRRLASSFHALRCTLENRLDALRGNVGALFTTERLTEDLGEDDADAEETDPDDAAAMERRALDSEERGDIERLLAMVATLPPDTKARRLQIELDDLRERGYAQAIVFTQYTDTLDYLRDFLRESGLRILCFSGRGGEFLQRDGNWRVISREDTKRRFKAGDADVLLCTDAAAEGLNFQFCGALINFDSPWNPMRIEQRIGRVDRLGQRHSEIAVVNLMYDDTVETDVYRALRQRIGLFTAVIGKLQPILSSLPARIAAATLAHPDERERVRAGLVTGLTQAIADSQHEPFDLDESTRVALEEVPRSPSPYDLADLWRLLGRPELLPPACTNKIVSLKEAWWTQPSLNGTLRVTTDPEFFEQHSDSVELWSPGSPAFGDRQPSGTVDEGADGATSLGELLDRQSHAAGGLPHKSTSW